MAHLGIRGRGFSPVSWRSGKYEEVYINDYEAVPDAEEGISRYMNFYNQERAHQSLDYKTPAVVYFISLWLGMNFCRLCF